MGSSRLLLLCIFSGGITAADISCVQCVGEKTCQGPAKKCPSDAEDCISIFEETKIGGKTKTSVFLRLCGNCSDYKSGAIRFGKGILKTSASCCKENNCTPADPLFPPPKPAFKDAKPKGIVCKSCFALNAKGCDCNNVFVNCTAEETRCIARSILATGKQGYTHVAAIRGCTTEDMCDFTKKELMVNTTKLTFLISCTNEGDSVRNSLLPLVLTAAMFCKLTMAT